MIKTFNIDKLKIPLIGLLPLFYLAISVLVNSAGYFSFSLFQKEILTINYSLDFILISYLFIYSIYLFLISRTKTPFYLLTFLSISIHFYYFLKYEEKLEVLLIKIFLFGFIFYMTLISKKIIFLNLTNLLVGLTLLCYLLNISKYSWLFFLLIPIVLYKDLGFEKVFLISLIIPLLDVFKNLDFLILIVIFILFIKDFDRVNYLNKYSFFSVSLIYCLLRFKELSYYLRTNPDTWSWMFSGIRMEIYNLKVYTSLWDYKGPVNGLIYHGIVKFANIFDLHLFDALTFIFLFIIFFITNYYFQQLNTYENKSKLFLFIIVIYLLLILTNEIKGQLRLDPRLVGSCLLTIGLHNFTKHNFFIGGVFTALSIFCLISFLIPVFFIGITLLILRKINYQIIFGGFSVFVFFGFYLFYTDQIQEYLFFNYQILFAFIEWEGNFTVLDFIKQFSLIFINLTIFYIMYLKHNRNRINTSVILYTAFLIGEVLHIHLTEARWYHYKILLVLPTVLLFYYLINENYKNYYFKFREFSILFLALIFIFGINSVSMFPNYIIPTNDFGLLKILNPDEPYLNERYSSHLLTKDIFEFKPAIFLTYEDEDYNYFFNEYGLIQTTRFSSYYWFVESSFTNNSLVDKVLIAELFKEDISNENPQYLVKNNNFEYSSISNPQFLSEVNKYTNLIYCTDTSCLYEKD